MYIAPEGTYHSRSANRQLLRCESTNPESNAPANANAHKDSAQNALMLSSCIRSLPFSSWRRPSSPVFDVFLRRRSLLLSLILLRVCTHSPVKSAFSHDTPRSRPRHPAETCRLTISGPLLLGRAFAPRFGQTQML